MEYVRFKKQPNIKPTMATAHLVDGAVYQPANTSNDGWIQLAGNEFYLNPAQVVAHEFQVGDWVTHQDHGSAVFFIAGKNLDGSFTIRTPGNSSGYAFVVKTFLKPVCGIAPKLPQPSVFGKYFRYIKENGGLVFGAIYERYDQADDRMIVIGVTGAWPTVDFAPWTPQLGDWITDGNKRAVLLVKKDNASAGEFFVAAHADKEKCGDGERFLIALPGAGEVWWPATFLAPIDVLEYYRRAGEPLKEEVVTPASDEEMADAEQKAHAQELAAREVDFWADNRKHFREQNNPPLDAAGKPLENPVAGPSLESLCYTPGDRNRENRIDHLRDCIREQQAKIESAVSQIELLKTALNCVIRGVPEPTTPYHDMRPKS